MPLSSSTASLAPSERDTSTTIGSKVAFPKVITRVNTSSIVFSAFPIPAIDATTTPDTTPTTSPSISIIIPAVVPKPLAAVAKPSEPPTSSIVFAMETFTVFIACSTASPTGVPNSIDILSIASARAFASWASLGDSTFLILDNALSRPSKDCSPMVLNS